MDYNQPLVGGPSVHPSSYLPRCGKNFTFFVPPATWDAMACATAATSGTPKTQLDVVLWATMESVVIVVYVSIAFMGIASLLHDAEQAHRWAPQDTLGARRAAQYSNAPNAKKPPVSPL